MSLAELIERSGLVEYRDIDTSWRHELLIILISLAGDKFNDLLRVNLDKGRPLLNWALLVLLFSTLPVELLNHLSQMLK